MSALVFLDTETTGLSLDDDIWEFAAIRREVDGTETEHHLFITHDPKKCAQLPDPFLRDHIARFPEHDCVGSIMGGSEEPYIAAHKISALFHDRPHVVGAVPNFDTERIALLLRRYGYEPGWHYHLIDVENLAVGFLNGLAAVYTPARALLPTLPWNSDDLSRACGVEPPTTGRHTAMGDARWARALYDAICEPVAAPVPVEAVAPLSVEDVASPVCDEHCWTEVRCTVCDKWKKPNGSSVAMEAANRYCDQECGGYAQQPKAPHLWSEHDSVRRFTDPVGWAAHEASCEQCGPSVEDTNQ